MKVNNRPRISILLRTFNSAKTLDAVITAMDLMEGDEVIVVDSGSTDATLQIAERHRCIIIKAPGPFNYSKSLNLGFRRACNDWVLVISSHCIPVVASFLEIFGREACFFPPDVLVGYAPASLSGKSDPALDPEKTGYFSREDYSRIGNVCGNGNTLYRRSAWEELPFDETLRTGEDAAWIREMLRRNYRFAYIPTARGLNKYQGSLRYMFLKGYNESRSYREPSHRPMPILHLGGALKNLAKQRLTGNIGTGNWIRCSAHTFGQFFGSHRCQDNTVPPPPNHHGKA